jgi:O-antigen/teichoic acid export membrane protein
MAGNDSSAETEKHLKTVTKGAGLVFAGLLFSKILTYFYRLIIARYYGPEDYGLISIGLSLITVLIVFLVLGMDSGIIRYVPEYNTKNDQKRVKGTILNSLRISLPLSVAVAALLWMLSPVLAGVFAKDAATQAGLTLVFQIFSVTLPFSACYNILIAASKGFQRMDYPVYADNIFFSTVLVSTVALFSLFGLGLGGIAASYAITIIVSFLFIFYFFNRRIFNLFGGSKAVYETRTLVGYSAPLFIGSVAGIVLGSFDTIFLGLFKNAADVGIYNAALPTAKFILVFSSAFAALFSPIIIEYRTRKMEREILTLYKTTTKWIFFTGLPFFLILMFFSKNVLNVMFGQEYVASATALSVLGMAFFVQSVLMTGHLMLIIDKTKYVMMTIIVATIISIFLDIALIPSYGILGAAIATSFSVVLNILLNSFFAWRFTRMNPFGLKVIFKSVFAGVISMSFIMLLYRYSGMVSSTFTLIPLFFLFLLAYSLLLVTFRALDKNDIFMLKEIEKKTGIRIGFARKIFKKLIR